MKTSSSISLILLMAVISILLSSCAGTQPTPTEIVSHTLTLGYIPNIQFAPIYVALEKGYFEEAGFEITLEYGKETDALALIGAGEQTFGIVSGEQVLLARAQGLPVTYVAAWYQKYPVGIVSLSTCNVLVPENLDDKTIGIPGLYGASYIGLRTLLDAGGLTEEDVELLSIGFNQVEALATGQVQSAVIYLANEPVVLASQGYSVDTIRVADYLQLVANGLVTNETTINESPEMVENMVGALVKGIEDTIADPDEAYEISKNYVENLEDANPQLQKAILMESIKLWESDQIGYSESAGWINMQQVLLDMKLLEEPQDLDEAFTNEFIP
jgi:NitT/TauT family transport system substrate-binding protein